METIDWAEVLDVLAKLAVAYVLALPVAWDRERQGRSAGLRTFPLVATASTAFALLARVEFGESPEAQARVVEGLITGIGFIGGGAILRQGENVQGTSTAASIWATAAIGAATAYGRYEIALVLSAIIFATLRLLTRFKSENDERAAT